MSGLSSKDFLYDLLPPFYRAQDFQVGEPLLALVRVLQSEVEILEENLGSLYADWFIATCADWVVPYVAELVGVEGLDASVHRAATQRSRVANTIAFRRRKGNAAVLGRAARDASGWSCYPKQFFETLGWSQNLSHLRRGRGGTADLRDEAALGLLTTPFNRIALTAHPSGPANGAPGNLPTLGLFFWRLVAYPLARRRARDLGAGRWTVNPLGLDVPLFSQPSTLADVATVPQPADLPLAIPRSALAADVAASRRGRQVGFLAPPAEIRLYVRWPYRRQAEEVPPRLWVVADLADWRWPAAADGAVLALDPELGRVLFPAVEVAEELLVSASYGFSGDYGGGPYQRPATSSGEVGSALGAAVGAAVGTSAPVSPDRCEAGTPARGGTAAAATLGTAFGTAAEARLWHALVYQSAPRGGAADEPPRFRTLQAALAAWEAWEAGGGVGDGVIEIADNGLYTPGRRRGGGVRSWQVKLSGRRRLSLLAGEGTFPCLAGNLSVNVSGGDGTASLRLAGLLVDGRLCLHQGLDLELEDCTLSPDRARADERPSLLTSRADVAGGSVSLVRCISGPLHLPCGFGKLQLADSILDAGAGWALTGFTPEDVPCRRPLAPPRDGAGGGDGAGEGDGAAAPPGPPTGIERCTVFGALTVDRLQAADSLFTGLVICRRRQIGDVSYSYVPRGSQPPRLYRCQPYLAVEGVTDPQVRRRLELELRPRFTSRRYGRPGFAQLATGLPDAIAAGASDGAEMGAFHDLYQPQRVQALPGVLAEYLPWGLDAAIRYET